MGYRVLIADDSELIRKVVESILVLSNDGYKIGFTTNGADTCKESVCCLPDLILLDWEMPDMNGAQVLKRLRRYSRTRLIPVIVMTGNENITEAFDAGATDFIHKPVKKEELIVRVRAVLKNRESVKVMLESKKAMFNKLKQYRHIVDIVNDSISAVLITDSNGEAEWVSKAFTNLFGYTKEEFEVRFGNQINNGKFMNNIKDYFRKSIEEKKVVNFKGVARNKTERKVEINGLISPVLDSEACLNKVVIVFSPID